MNFNVGDWVVYVDNFMPKEIMRINFINGSSVWMDVGKKRCEDFMIKLATPKEIKQGCRDE